MTTRFSLRFLVPLLALAIPLDAGAQQSYGPLPSQEGGPLQRIGFTHTVEGADLVEAGSVQAETRIAYSNIFEEDSASTHRLFLDLERLSTDVGLRWGVTQRLEAGARLAFETTGAGVLDGFISGWHETLGLPNANRGRYPLDEYAQRLADGVGRVRLDLPRRTLALEDVRLSLKWRAWESADARRALTLSGGARLPMQDKLIGPRRTDVSLAALGRLSGERWHLHTSVGGATVRAAQDFAGLLRPAAFFADLAVERNLASWVSGVVQLSLESPRLQGFHDAEVDGWPVNLLFGVTGEVARWRFDVGFQEDIPAKSPAVDFTLGIGVRRTL
jgi:hypothetical protein